MKRLNKFNLLQIATAFLAVAFLFTSCKKDEKDPIDDPHETPEDYTLSLFSFIGDFGYLLGVESADSGTVSVKGNGIELNTYGVSVIQHKGYYYVWNSAESTVDQFKAQGTSFTKVTSIAVPPLLPDERPRVMRATHDDKLILNSWPDSEGNVYYALISLPDFSLSKKGNLPLDSLGIYGPQTAEFVVAGSKAYLGTSYFDTSGTLYPDSIITYVYDYPSFTNGKRIFSDAAGGSTGGYVGLSNIADETGDIYQAPINSKHWGYSGEDAYILKLSNGAYDNSYKFNLSQALGKQIGLWSILYAENGIAYAKITAGDDGIGWGPLRNSNTVTLVKVDLYNKTAIELNIPTFLGFYLQNGAVADGKFYVPVSMLGSESNIYSIEINGGANDFTKGATIDGESVLVGSMFKH